jgi:membrane protease YdiL (CAAX protease family)
VLSAVLRLMPAGARGGRAGAIAISSVAFGVFHLPGMVALFGGLVGVPLLAWVWFIALNALVGAVFGALYLRHGIGAAIASHWFCDLVWHVGSVW